LTSRSTPTPKANPTPKPTPRPTPTSTPTPTPSGLTGVQTGKHVDLTWQASAGAVTYDVYRGKGSGLITLLEKGVTKTSYRDLTVTPGTSYSYQVSAIGSSGSESRRSRIFTITIT
jgi:fibronectin type 3 domain-containing protein